MGKSGECYLDLQFTELWRNAFRREIFAIDDTLS